ncbi:MAG: hypothetical protein IBJ03_06235 [Gemmatimonadaceae bacterium]|nr:hypothetical protein [Gemmatimonadaceae bacterium]
MASSRSTAAPLLSDEESTTPGPIACSDSLARTAAETCRQHERLSKLMALSVSKPELAAALALVDTIDLALAEAVAEFEKKCAKSPVSEQPDIRAAANAMWLSAREYLRRHSIAEKASRQITQGGDSLGDLQLEYELEASALLGLKQATATYQKLRPETRC